MDLEAAVASSIRESFNVVRRPWSGVLDQRDLHVGDLL
jgi:hypothetical protein